MSPAGERGYHRAIEEAWSHLRGRPIVLSPREFEIIEGWRTRGVPLSVVLECIDAEAKRGGRGKRSLAHLAAPVDEAWRAVAAGRAARLPDAPAAVDPADPGSPAIGRLPGDDPLRALILRLREEAAAGASPDAVDERLDRELLERIPAAMRARAAEEAGAALASFRARMPRDEFERTLARATIDRLRAELGLPRRLVRRAR